MNELPDDGETMGYGPAQFRVPAEVKQIAAALSGFPIAEKLKGWNADEASARSVYCPHEADELKIYFEELLKFYSTAAQRGDAVISYLI